MAALLLKQIERGTISFATGDVTLPVTLSTTLTSTAKTVLLFSAKSPSATPGHYNILGRVLSASGIQFERFDTGDVATVDYQVIEFTQGINVQHFYFSQASGTINTTISTVNLNKAFPILTMTQTGSTFGANDLYSAEITTATNLATTTGSVSASPVAVQVIEIDESSTQKVTGVLETDNITDITVSGIVENKTIWLFGVNFNTSFNFQSIPYLNYVNSTTLRFNRFITSSGAAFNHVTYVVQASGIDVQNVAVTIPSGSNNTTPTFTSGTLSNTALLINSVYQRMSSTTNSSDDAGFNHINLSGLTATSFVASRGDTPSFPVTTNVQVIRFNTTASVAYPKINISGVWRNVTNMHVNVDGIWRNVTNVNLNISGVWRTLI